MGRPKALLEYAGRSFAARVADALRGQVGEIHAVGDGPLPADLGEVVRLADAPGLEGPLAGIVAALRHRPESAWLIAACDLPLADPAAVRWLLEQRGPERVAVLPRLGADRVEPLLAVYEPGALPILEALAERGERSLQALAREAGVATPAAPAAIAGAWRNVNDEDDFRGLAADRAR
jgi:molybdopterin-guanine dinucleotide biosynthesis protein A